VNLGDDRFTKWLVPPFIKNLEPGIYAWWVDESGENGRLEARKVITVFL
jgi:hypothetical protein